MRNVHWLVHLTIWLVGSFVTCESVSFIYLMMYEYLKITGGLHSMIMSTVHTLMLTCILWKYGNIALLNRNLSQNQKRRKKCAFKVTKKVVYYDDNIPEFIRSIQQN